MKKSVSRIVNLKWLAGLLGIIVVIGVGTHFLHEHQVRQQGETLLRESNRAEEHQQWDRAIDFLQRYVLLEPGDTETLSRLGLLLDNHPATHDDRLRALSVYQQVLRREPDRNELRRLTARRAIEMGRHVVAREHLDLLLAEKSNDGELQLQLGQCEEAAGRYDAALDAYQRAIDSRPSQIEGFHHRAMLLRRRMNQSVEADQVMEQMISLNEDNFRAYLERAAYRRQFNPGKADEDVAKALQLAPNEAEVLLMAAELAQDKGDLSKAREYLQRGLQQYPQESRMYQALADLELRAGQAGQALAELRRGVEALPNEPRLLWRLGDLLIQGRQLDAAGGVIHRLSQLRIPPAMLDCLRARIQVVQGAWPDAVRLLERGIPELQAVDPNLAKEAILLLAQCHRELGDSEQSLAACRRAVAADPLWPPARIALGRELAEAGRIDEALEVYQPLVGTTAEAQEAVARLLFLHNQRMPTAVKNWENLEKFLDQTAQKLPKSLDIVLMQAEVCAARKQFDGARKKLEAALQQHPGQVAVYSALARLYLLQEQPQKGLAVLDEAQKRLGDTADLYLARIQFWSLQHTSEGRHNLDRLAQRWESYPFGDHPRILNALAETYHILGETNEPMRLWSRLAAMQPTNVRVRLLQLDLAVEIGDLASLQRVLNDMRGIERQAGPLSRYARAASLYLEAVQGNKEGLNEARRLLTEVAPRRPSWAQVPLLVGRIEELEGNLGRALDQYQRAIDLGNRHPAVMRRVVQLLYDRRHYTEAEMVLRRLPDAATASRGFDRLAAEVALRNRDYERALQLARKAVSEGSTDYRDHLWLGQVFSLAGRNDDAETSLRRATQLAEHAPDAWVALVQHLAQSGQTAKADHALQEAGPKLPKQQATLVLAQCQEVLGRPDQAATLYRKAAAEQPEDPAALRAVAGFYLRTGRSSQAEPLFRRLLDPRGRAPEADVAWARRWLAVALAGTGDYADVREALGMVERNLRNFPNNSDDLQAKALVLASHANSRREGLHLLETVGGKRDLPPEQQFFLTRLYEGIGDWPRARATILALLAQEQNNPRYVAYYARSLFRREETDQALIWHDKLKHLEPRSFDVFELKLRALKSNGQVKEAAAAASSYIEDKGTNVALVAALLDDVGLSDAAQEIYQKRLAGTGRPEALLSYIKFLSDQKRLPEALDQCERAWDLCKPEDAAVITGYVLSAGQPNTEQYERAHDWINLALRRTPNSIPLLIARAVLLEQQARYPEAETVYRNILQQDAMNALALANLACLLARRRDQGEEALSLINQGIEGKGPLPDLLDSRAVVYLRLGRADLAIQDLREALAKGASAALEFHLALALDKANDRPAALASLQKALAVGLMEMDVHPAERSSFRQLKGDLETKTGPTASAGKT
jgi:tetratricopeptide (TPR) repeat protein